MNVCACEETRMNPITCNTTVSACDLPANNSPLQQHILTQTYDARHDRCPHVPPQLLPEWVLEHGHQYCVCEPHGTCNSSIREQYESQESHADSIHERSEGRPHAVAMVEAIDNEIQEALRETQGLRLAMNTSLQELSNSECKMQETQPDVSADEAEFGAAEFSRDLADDLDHACSPPHAELSTKLERLDSLVDDLCNEYAISGCLAAGASTRIPLMVSNKFDRFHTAFRESVEFHLTWNVRKLDCSDHTLRIIAYDFCSMLWRIGTDTDKEHTIEKSERSLAGFLLGVGGQRKPVVEHIQKLAKDRGDAYVDALRGACWEALQGRYPEIDWQWGGVAAYCDPSCW